MSAHLGTRRAGSGGSGGPSRAFPAPSDHGRSAVDIPDYPTRTPPETGIALIHDCGNEALAEKEKADAGAINVSKSRIAPFRFRANAPAPGRSILAW